MTANEVGRNDPCPCGSGKKYKHCCLRKDKRRRRARVTASAAHPREQADNLLGQIRHVARQLKSRRPDDEAKDLLVGLERAFEAVGYPSRFGEGPSQQDMETLAAASRHLAGDRENRERLARQLMTALPEYVSAGRYRDAWLIQHSAYLTAERAELSNPFLFTMLQLAYEEWEQRVAEEQEALMRELGIDPSALRGSAIQEVEVELEKLMADPLKKARLDAFYDARPALREQATADFMQLEEDALKLLARDDSERLLLSVEEVAPWLPVLQERLEPLVRQVWEAVTRGEEPDPETVRATQEGFMEMTVEMAPAIFTAERIDELAAAADRARAADAEEGAG